MPACLAGAPRGSPVRLSWFAEVSQRGRPPRTPVVVLRPRQAMCLPSPCTFLGQAQWGPRLVCSQPPSNAAGLETLNTPIVQISVNRQGLYLSSELHTQTQLPPWPSHRQLRLPTPTYNPHHIRDYLCAAKWPSATDGNPLLGPIPHPCLAWLRVCTLGMWGTLGQPDKASP